MSGTPYAGTDTWATTIDIPDDGDDPRDAAALNTPFEGTLDRTKWLYNCKRIIAEGGFSDGADGGAVAYSDDSVFNTSPSAYDLTLLGGTITVAIGDIVLMYLSFNGVSGPTKGGEYRLAYKIGSATNVTVFPGARAKYDPAFNTAKPFALVGRATMGAAGGLYLYAQCRVLTIGAGEQTDIIAPYSGFVQVWRGTAR